MIRAGWFWFLWGAWLAALLTGASAAAQPAMEKDAPAATSPSLPATIPAPLPAATPSPLPTDPLGPAAAASPTPGPVEPAPAETKEPEQPAWMPPSTIASNPGMALIHKVEFRRRWMTSLEGKFIQVHSSPLFLSDVLTTGTFHFTRDPWRLRCDMVSMGTAITSPVRSVLWVYGGYTYDYIPESNQVTMYAPRLTSGWFAKVNFLLLGFFVNTKEAVNLFAVERVLPDPDERHFRLKLAPYFPAEMGGVSLLLVDFEKKALYPTRVFLTQEDGEQTEIHLSDVQINVPVDEAFESRLTPSYRGAKVIRYK